MSFVKTAQIGGEIGSVLGPVGELVGGIIGAGLGLGLTAAAHPSDSEDTNERYPLIPRHNFSNPLNGRDVPTPRPQVQPSPPAAPPTQPPAQTTIRQRPNTRVPGRDNRANNAIDRAARISAEREARAAQRSRDRYRLPRIRPGAVAGAAAAATAATAGIATQLPNFAGRRPGIDEPLPPDTTAPNPPDPTPIPPDTTIPQPTPVDEEPVLIEPSDTKEPEIPADVMRDHFVMINAQKQGNYTIPVYGRHNYIDWSEYTEGNALASIY